MMNRMQKPTSASNSHTTTWARQNTPDVSDELFSRVIGRMFMSVVDAAPRRSSVTSTSQSTAMLRAIIVDDEAPARRYLRRLLVATASVRIEGEAAALEQARRLIRDHQPDVLFLD